MKPGDFIRITSCHPALNPARDLVEPQFRLAFESRKIGCVQQRRAPAALLSVSFGDYMCSVYTDEVEIVTDEVEIATAKLLQGI